MKVAVKKTEKKMNKIEIFSAGCPLCKETVEHIKKKICESCEVIVYDLHDPSIAERTKRYDVKRVPSVVINGQLSPCCKCEGIKIDV